MAGSRFAPVPQTTLYFEKLVNIVAISIPIRNAFHGDKVIDGSNSDLQVALANHSAPTEESLEGVDAGKRDNQVQAAGIGLKNAPRGSDRYFIPNPTRAGRKSWRPGIEGCERSNQPTSVLDVKRHRQVDIVRQPCAAMRRNRQASDQHVAKFRLGVKRSENLGGIEMGRKHLGMSSRRLRTRQLSAIGQ